MIERSDITGAVLAGGEGRRMGGADKGLLPYGQGHTLASRVLARLSPQVGRLLVSANRNLDRYASLGHPVVRDEAAGAYLGPLAGMLAALRACATPWLVTVPCDCPEFPLDLVERLAAVAAPWPTQPLVAFVATPGDSEHPLHPAFCLAHRSVDASLASYLRHGGRAMRPWLAQQGALAVAFDDAAPFRNLNTPGELQAASPPSGPPG